MGGWLPAFDLLKLEGCAPKFMLPKLLMKEGGGGGGSYLPLDKKRSGDGGWKGSSGGGLNGLKPDQPNPGSEPDPEPEGGLESMNGGDTGLTGESGPLLLLLLSSLLFFGNLFVPFSLSISSLFQTLFLVGWANS